ncbi:MAG: hypothetical protein J6C52_01110, partial [Clostridia bacterium]|nr:hypothetical protein [Clostridia bacterium]
ESYDSILAYAVQAVNGEFGKLIGEYREITGQFRRDRERFCGIIRQSVKIVCECIAVIYHNDKIRL